MGCGTSSALPQQTIVTVLPRDATTSSFTNGKHTNLAEHLTLADGVSIKPTPQRQYYLPPSFISRHNTSNSLYLLIRSRVYDVTDFLDSHPGGRDHLLRYAGTDATKAFEFEHDGSQRVKEKLGKMCIGVLVTEGDARAGRPMNEDEDGLIKAARGGNGSPALKPAHLNVPGAAAAYGASNTSAFAASPSRSIANIAASPSGAQFSVLQSYPVADVRTHNLPGDCWTIRKGLVYDLAKYFSALTYREFTHLPQIDLKKVAGIDSTAYFDTFSSPAQQDAVTIVLERCQIGFLTGQSLAVEHVPVRRNSNAGMNPPQQHQQQNNTTHNHTTNNHNSHNNNNHKRMHSTSAMEALNAIAADDLTHAAAEGLIASPSAVRYLWTLVAKSNMTHDTALLTFEPLLDPRRIDAYRATFDPDEVSLQRTYPVLYASEALTFRSGQHVSIEIPKQLPRENTEEHANRERENRPLDVPFRMQRSYTPINSWQRPDENPRHFMQLLVKLYEGSEIELPGAGSSYMHSLQIGDITTSTTSRGLFSIDQAYDSYDTFIMICAGTGITPIYTVMREILRRSAAAQGGGGLSPTNAGANGLPAQMRLGERAKTVVLITANHSEHDELLTTELDSLSECYPDELTIFHILSQPMSSPKHASFQGQISIDILRFCIPAHLQPSVMKLDVGSGGSGSNNGSDHARPGSASGMNGVGAGGMTTALGNDRHTPSGPLTQDRPGLLSESRTGSRPQSRPRSPSRFTFGIPQRRERGDSPSANPSTAPQKRTDSPGLQPRRIESPGLQPRRDSPSVVGGTGGPGSGRQRVESPAFGPSLGDDLPVPDRLKGDDNSIRSRAALALTGGSRQHSRRPSVSTAVGVGLGGGGLFLSGEPASRKALCLLCGPPGFNQNAMSLMYKFGFKRGMGNGYGKDLFVF